MTSDSLAMDMGTCFEYVEAITRNTWFYQQMGSKTVFCPPETNISNGQAVRILIRYLEQNPEILHKLAFLLANGAFMEAFPCQAETK